MINLQVKNNKEKELERILTEVRTQMQGTVISYPERDPRGFRWGEPSYNGNCSGKVALGFIDKLGAKNVCELYAGSGTLSDVCRDYGLNYCGIDLNPNPVRKDIISMDICDIDTDLPNSFYEADMVFSHPPYPGIQHIKYCDSAWRDTVGGLSAKDIQNMDFKQGMKKINLSTMRAYMSIPKGSFIVILVGEIRAKNQYMSMYQHLALPGEIFQSYVKLQHNTWSSRQGTYSTSQRALTSHEMIVVLKKPSGYELCYIYPKEAKMDIRDCNTATWKDVVSYVMQNLKSASLQMIYKEIEGYSKCKKNPNWQAKVRQTLQFGPYVSNGSGYWQLAS